MNKSNIEDSIREFINEELYESDILNDKIKEEVGNAVDDLDLQKHVEGVLEDWEFETDQIHGLEKVVEDTCEQYLDDKASEILNKELDDLNNKIEDIKTFQDPKFNQTLEEMVTRIVRNGLWNLLKTAWSPSNPQTAQTSESVNHDLFQG